MHGSVGGVGYSPRPLSVKEPMEVPAQKTIYAMILLILLCGHVVNFIRR
jgi:hypothetical protein